MENSERGAVLGGLLGITDPLKKVYGIDFSSGGGALTLSPSSLGKNTSGWEISGEVYEDYYGWVNEFEAINPKFGRVWGDFEHEVYFDSLAGFEDFWKNHEPEAWDYQDI